MNQTPGPVLIISGPPGAGKTSVAREVVARFERAVHLDLDYFMDAVRGGFIEPWLPESHGQNQAVALAGARAMAPYAQAGYTVVADGIVLPWSWEIYQRELRADGIEPKVAVLLPAETEAVRRGATRTPFKDLPESVYREMHRQFRAATEELPTIDTSRLSRSQTADAVLSLLGITP